MEKYFEINKNGHNVRCKLYYGKNSDIEKAVLFVHGFAGHKDNGAAQKFAERLLSKYKGIALITFNLPCHGDDVKKKLTLPDCMTYIYIVADYIKSGLGVREIYSYATSFGGYLVLKYITEHENPFKKIALRCPAVNMAEVLTRSIMKNDELDKLLKGKNVQVGFDRKIEISRQFLSELEESDIQKINYLDYADDILILHGTKDEVVPIEAVRRFADDNLIEFIPVENADHRFQNPACMEIATKKVIDFFGF
jgi:uncharacterized protein